MVEESVQELVERYTRNELNLMAAREGVSDPEGLPNKTRVAQEIVRARKASKYSKRPPGLYMK